MYHEQKLTNSTTTVTLKAVPARAAVVRRRSHQNTYAISAWDLAKNIAVEILISEPSPAMEERLGTVQPVPGTQTYSVIVAHAGVQPLRGLLESLNRNSRLTLDMEFDGSVLTSFSLRRPEAEGDNQCLG